jgi:hypothetical protein
MLLILLYVNINSLRETKFKKKKIKLYYTEAAIKNKFANTIA